MDLLLRIVPRERLVELAQYDNLTKAQISDELNYEFARQRLPVIRAWLAAFLRSAVGAES